MRERVLLRLVFGEVREARLADFTLDAHADRFVDEMNRIAGEERGSGVAAARQLGGVVHAERRAVAFDRYLAQVDAPVQQIVRRGGCRRDDGRGLRRRFDLLERGRERFARRVDDRTTRSAGHEDRLILCEQLHVDGDVLYIVRERTANALRERGRIGAGCFDPAGERQRDVARAVDRDGATQIRMVVNSNLNFISGVQHRCKRRRCARHHEHGARERNGDDERRMRAA